MHERVGFWEGSAFLLIDEHNEMKSLNINLFESGLYLNNSCILEKFWLLSAELFQVWVD